MSNSKKKVFVGLSGGVDSSVSAAMLKKQGYDITGVFIKTWQPDWLPCTWRDERRDAMRVAATLDIPFITLDLEKEYKQKVADYMIDEYRQGRTPNPDIMCNKEIKFGSFLKKALEMGADYIATGHYAQIPPPSVPPQKGGKDASAFSPLLPEERLGEVGLIEGADENKDQSYFLWTLTQKQLEHILFPVGHLQKDEVRKLAHKFKLPTADKKDSQGICFLGKVDMKEFLKHYINEKEGDVLNQAGEIVGKHDGVWFHTIGERHGFEIFKKTDHDDPYYVIRKNIEENQIVVTQKKPNTVSEFAANEAILKDINLIRDMQITSARLRYRQKKQSASFNGNTHTISFELPQEGMSVGQSIVFYNNSECLGGGVIAEVLV